MWIRTAAAAAIAMDLFVAEVHALTTLCMAPHADVDVCPSIRVSLFFTATIAITHMVSKNVVLDGGEEG